MIRLSLQRAGTPGIATRDGGVCDRWVHDPYFQYFTGEEFFQHPFPHERSDLSHWRKRFGDKVELLLAESLRVAHTSGRCAGRPWHGSRDAQWDGARLAESKLLLVADQGYGDAIQFVRYIPSEPRAMFRRDRRCRSRYASFIRQVSPAGQLVDRWERAAHRLPPIARRRACHACTARRSQ